MTPLIKTIGLDIGKITKLNESLIKLNANFSLDSASNFNNKNSDSIVLIGADNITLKDFYKFLDLSNEENYKILILLPMVITDISIYLRNGIDFCMPPHSAREIMMRINLLQGSNEKDTNITMEL